MTLLLVGLGLCLLGAFASCLSSQRRVGIAVFFGASGCLVAFVASLHTLVTGGSSSLHTSELLPLNGVSLTLDPLGAIFIVATALVGFASCLYCVSYARGEMKSRSALALFMIFIASLLAVPSASNVATLMFFWELMAVSSMLLIVVEHRRHQPARSAALWYGVMTQSGAGVILLGLLLLTIHGGAQNFTAISAHAHGLPSLVRSAGFALTLVGFASKAGAVPLHVWLPKAHPEAPSPVSAMMSSSMVAMGVYGIIRVGDGLLHGGNVSWWVAVIAFGALSALYGALHATTSTDLKRLLAYSTIDMLGLVLIGVGAAGALRDSGHPGAAALAMTAALLLMVAHAGFKGALFLGAGAIERATGTRDLDQLGGLVRTMPTTTALFALSACSIMAIPTLSGFSGEWLLLQGLLHGFHVGNTPTLIALLAGVVALALSGGLTAVAFVKALGIGFLGRARSLGAAEAHEVAPTMRLAMALLGVVSIILGVVPGVVVPLLNSAAHNALSISTRAPLARGTGLVLTQFRGDIEPLLLFVGFIAVFALVWIVNRQLAHRSARRVDAWACGRDLQTARMQYTATSFAEPLQRVFADVLRPQADIEVTHIAESRYYEQSLRYENQVRDSLEQHAYQPLIALTLRVGTYARRIQNGSIHRYLAFGFVGLLLVLVVLG
jgi:formate hydrogenlyase subunit 3/multisubunit Na+/H+ antiporter MnhD subunit